MDVIHAADSPLDDYLRDAGFQEAAAVELPDEQATEADEGEWVTFTQTNEKGAIPLTAGNGEAPGLQHTHGVVHKCLHYVKDFVSTQPPPKVTYTLQTRRDAALTARLFSRATNNGDKSQEEAFADRLRYIIIASALLENAPQTPINATFQETRIRLPIAPPRQFRQFKFTLTKLLLWAIPPAFASVPVVNPSKTPALALLGGWKAALPPLLLAGLVLTLQVTQSIEIKDRRAALIQDIESLLALCKEADAVLQDASQFIMAESPRSDIHLKFDAGLDTGATFRTPGASSSLNAFRNARDQAERDEIKMHTMMLRRGMHDAITEAIKAYKLAAEALVHMVDESQYNNLLDMYAVHSPEEAAESDIGETPIAEPPIIPAPVTRPVSQVSLPSPGLRELKTAKILALSASRPVSVAASAPVTDKVYDATPKRLRSSWSHAPAELKMPSPVLKSALSQSTGPPAVALQHRRRKEVHSLEAKLVPAGGTPQRRTSLSALPLNLGSPLGSATLMQRRRSASPTVLEASRRLQDSRAKGAATGSPRQPSPTLPQLSASLPVHSTPVRRLSLAPSDCSLPSTRQDFGRTSPRRFSFLSQSSSPQNAPTDPFSGPPELSMASLTATVQDLSRERKKFLCAVLAIESKRYSSSVDLSFISRTIRALDSSSSTLIMEVRHAIDRIRWHKILDTPPVSSNEFYAPLPGAWRPPSPYLESREPLPHLQSDGFAPVKDQKTQNKELCQGYRRHLAGLGVSLQSVANKLNDSNRRLQQHMHAQDSEIVSDGEEDLHGLVDRHDSIKVELDGLFNQWKEGRVLVRSLAKPKHVRRSLQVHAGDVQSARDIDDLFDAISEAPESDLARSSSSKGRRASSSLFSSELQTPESRSPLRIHIADEYFGGDNPLGLVVEEDEGATEVFEGVAGEQRRATLQKLTRQERIQVAKAQREESGSGQQRDSLTLNAPMMTELKAALYSMDKRRHSRVVGR